MITSRIARTGYFINGVIRSNVNRVYRATKRIRKIRIMKNPESRPMIIGHRGAPDIYFQNTMESFDTAIKLGADMIEMDVHLSADNHVIVVHDNRLDELAGYKRQINKLTLKEIRKIRLKDGSRIPTLDDVFKRFKKRVLFMIEIKSISVTYPLVRLIEKHKISSKVIVSSFAHPVISIVNKINPKIVTLVICVCCAMRPEEMVLDAQARGLVNLSDTLVSRTVKRCHKNEQIIFSFPISIEDTENKTELRKLVNMGVDGIITNNIGRVNELFSTMKISNKKPRFELKI
ncbi:glycerophosphodiester phosphodiesterase [Candidatus Woesearchaeota archaeon]|nr:glycerophosphodiester phosphodiesterase [Candidatus Woesearchaeota archaeon]